MRKTIIWMMVRQASARGLIRPLADTMNGSFPVRPELVEGQMNDLKELYQEVILDHNKKPRNFHKMEEATHHAEGYNPLCGDQIQLFLKMNGNRIEDISFQGSGCAISKASSSMMTSILKGKTIEEAEKLFEGFHQMVTGDVGAKVSENLGKLTVFSGVCEFPARVKCASLAWHTMKAALEGKVESVKTE